MAEKLILWGGIIQGLGVGLLFLNLLAVKRYLQPPDVPGTQGRESLEQAQPMTVRMPDQELEARVDRLEESLHTTRESAASGEWELEVRLDEARQRLEEMINSELDAVRKVLLGGRFRTVFWVGLASICLIICGLGLSTWGSLIAL